MNDFPWLTVLIVVPLVGALVTAFVPKAPELGAAQADRARLLAADARRRHRRSPRSTTPATACSSTETHTWIEAFGVHYALGVDGLGLLLILLTVVLVPVVFVASWHEADGRSPAVFFAWALALEALRAAACSPRPTCSSSTSSSRPR